MLMFISNKRRRMRGQGIIEYLLLVTAVLVALILFFRRGSTFERSYTNVIETQGDILTNETVRMFF